MSEAKFKAPQEVIDKLDDFRKQACTIFELLSDMMETPLQHYENKMIKNGVTENQIDQAIVDYVVWKKDTIELEREPHYVIKRYDEEGIATSVYYKCEHGLGIGSDVFGDEMVRYEDGWPKEKANQLNEFVKGKLVEVK